MLERGVNDGTVAVSAIDIQDAQRIDRQEMREMPMRRGLGLVGRQTQGPGVAFDSQLIEVQQCGLPFLRIVLFIGVPLTFH